MPMQTVNKPSYATYRDVLDAPANMIAEVVRGTLHTHPRPTMRHAYSGSSLGYDLSGPFKFGRGEPSGWWIIDEPELHLGSEIVVPDLAGWRRKTMPDYPDAAYCTITPDWVCEILSPATYRFDLGQKRPLYASEGVKHLCLVDPTKRKLEAFELKRGQWFTIASLEDNDPVSVRPFEAITFTLADLWPETSDE